MTVVEKAWEQKPKHVALTRRGPVIMCLFVWQQLKAEETSALTSSAPPSFSFCDYTLYPNEEMQQPQRGSL